MKPGSPNRPVLKINLDQLLADGGKVVVELGCGSTKAEGRVGIDIVDLPEVDIVADINCGLDFLPNLSVDEIHSTHVLEHITNFELLMREMERVLKPEGRIYITVPHFSNPYYYSDYTHVRFFGLYTFYYFVESAGQLRRKVPTFYSNIRFSVIQIQLKFRSHFKLFHIFKSKVFQSVVNYSSWTQMLYEEMFPYLLPCYEICVVLSKPKLER